MTQTLFVKGANPSVNLTIEGDVSLVGDVCPGTVKIQCYGEDLSILRWRYNGNMNRVTFFSDAIAPSTIRITNNPAFLQAELLSVAPSVDRNFANFSSVLIVHVAQLQLEGITNIVCGNPQTFESLPVDVNVIQEPVPETPSGTMVTAAYESGLLMEVIVSWNKQVSLVCSN